MKIELKLYASLASHMPKKTGRHPYVMAVHEGPTIQDIIDEVDVPRASIKLIFLNGVHANGDEILKEGDKVGIFPAVAGG
jgi:molybdopterin converting factor small subunit